VLSIKTTKPKAGRSARYDDAISDDGYFSYAFQGDDPRNRDNTALRKAFENHRPASSWTATRAHCAAPSASAPPAS
jgi:putative restriction endonuclease